MHYLVGVILPLQYSGEKLHEAIGEILKPWDENNDEVSVDRTEDGETWRHNPNGQWDFWSLGGRWSGVWSDYEPKKDPANHEPCWLCAGTGLRNDYLGQEARAQNPDYTCNGCSEGPRPGVALKWPTQWAPREDANVIPVADFIMRESAQIPYTLCMAPDVWLSRDTWTGTDFIKHEDHDERVMELLIKYRDMFIAAVDIHS